MSAGYAHLSAAFQADPLGSLALTGPQAAWVQLGSPQDRSADGRPLLWLGANQIGKSYAQAAKLLHFVRATGPYSSRRPGPVTVTIVSISKEQIIPLMEKIWELLPKSDNDKGEPVPTECPAVRFEPGFGFRGKPPRIVFKRGPAAGSVVTFATYKQGSTRIAGATLDALLLDEPPPESLWGEVVLRLLRRSGQIWISMTITPESPPQDWLKEKADKDIVRYMQTPLTVASVTPLGLPPFLTKAKIDKARRETPEAEIPLRFEAAWTGARVERWLSAWNPNCVRQERIPAGCVGIISLDHGIRPGRQAVALLAFQPSTGRFWLLDEIAGGDEATSSAQDAAKIALLLGRNSYSWTHIDLWAGDRSTASTRRDARKDNSALRRYLAAHYGVEIDQFPAIRTPYKADGTLLGGYRQMNALFANDKMVVFPGCVQFIKAAEQWNGDKRSPLKDILDAARYGMESALLSYNLTPATLTHQKTR